MILSLIDDIKSYVGGLASARTKPRIDSLLFLSLRVGAMVTAAACVLVTARTYIGDNINCTTMDGKNDDETGGAIESYCFISATFTLSNVTMPGATAHPGVGPIPHREVFPPGKGPDATVAEEEVTRHSYYQWVPFMLVIQSLMLHLPWTLWNNKEDDYLSKLLGDTHHVHVSKEDEEKHCRESAGFFDYSRLHNNTSYLLTFLVYEVLGAAVAVGNLFLTNVFLGGKFFYFGIGVSKYLTSSVTDVNNPLNEVFPKVGKCMWYMYGPTGSIVSRDAMCVLPLNIVNEKTYIVLCLTYVLMAVVTSLALLYHVYLYIIPGRLDFHILSASPQPHKDAVRALLPFCDKGDKFILWNMRSYIVNFPLWISDVAKDKQS